MNIEAIEQSLRTLADVAYRRNANSGANEDAAIAEAFQTLATELTAAIRTTQQDIQELRRRIAP